MLLHSHAGELLLVQKNNPARGIILHAQHGASPALRPAIYAPCCLFLKPLRRCVDPSGSPVNVRLSVSMAAFNVHEHAHCTFLLCPLEVKDVKLRP